MVRRTEKKDGVWAKGAKLGRKLMMDLDMRVICVCMKIMKIHETW